MKPKEIISKENLEKLGFTRYNDAGGPGGGLGEYFHKDCSFIKITCFLSVWHLELSSIYSSYYAEISGTKTSYELADFNPQNNARFTPHPELTTNDKIIEIMLKWIDGARIYHQNIVDKMLRTADTIRLLKVKFQE